MLGARVARFSNAEVLTEGDAVLERIRQLMVELDTRGPLTPALAPGRGEGD
jgi:very-short-patch-repair endonuclease